MNEWWGLKINGELSAVILGKSDRVPSIYDFNIGYYSSQSEYDIVPLWVEEK